MTLVQTLIASAQADENKLRKSQEHAEQTARETSFVALRRLLPAEVWEALGWDQTTYSGADALAHGTVEIRGEAIPWFAKSRYGGLYIGSEPLNIYVDSGRGEDSQDTVSRFLLSLDRSIVLRREKERLERLRDIERIFGYRISRDDDPVKMVGLRDEAVALAPERFNEFMALYDDWMKRKSSGTTWPNTSRPRPSKKQRPRLSSSGRLSGIARPVPS